MIVSVVIRTLNEERYLGELLEKIRTQKADFFEIEIVVVDSGSIDNSLQIASAAGARITHIEKKDFSFGRSLNIGCDFATGNILVFVSGHCIPVDNNWLRNLIKPISEGICAYTYGRQIGRDSTKFSERQLFDKYFQSESRIPQIGFFCNNANAAIERGAWAQFRFDENLTGCEDMHLAKRIVAKGGKIGYVADSVVYHIHDEPWRQVLRRYEREAIALRDIIPEVQLSRVDVASFIVVGVIKDVYSAWRKGTFLKEFFSIILFRCCQYIGAYRGNKLTKKISNELKSNYFFPRVTSMDIKDDI